MTITHKGHPLFFVDQLSSHTWLPRRGLSSSLMCPPRPPTVAATAPWPASSRWLSATAPQPAVPPPQRPGQQCLRHGAPASNTSATVHRPLPPRRPGQQRPASNISAATAPRPASSRWRSATAHGQQCLRHGAPASSTSATAPRPLLSALLPAAASRCCRIVFHAGTPAERQLFRTDFRFAPSLPQRFACGPPPIHEGHGRPRSVRKSSRLRWKCLSMDCRCSDRRKSLGPSAPIAYATSVSPPNEAVAWPCARVLGAG